MENIISNSLLKNYLNFFDQSGEVKLEDIRSFLGVPKAELAKAFGMSADQLRDDRLSSKTEERLKELAAALEFVADTFEGDINKTRFWLNTPNPNFGGATPKNLIVRGRYNKLLKFILAAKQGV
jgi:putative toxin-antitoxin system antitoxin component (TIGR02293 family)